MELGVVITLMIGLGFVSILAYKAFQKYSVLESDKHLSVATTKFNFEKHQLATEIETLANSNRNYIYKIRKLRDNYELDYEDIEFENEDNEDMKVSDLAKSIYPKLPESIAKLIDKEEFQNAILKTVEKRPDIINTFIDRYVNKTDSQSSRGPPPLTERYL